MKAMNMFTTQKVFPTWRFLIAGCFALMLLFPLSGCDISPVPTPIPADEGGEYDDDYDEFGGVGSSAGSVDDEFMFPADPQEENTSAEPPENGEGSEEADNRVEEEGSGNPPGTGGEGAEPSEGGGEEGGGGSLPDEDGYVDEEDAGSTSTPKDVCGPSTHDSFGEMDAGTLGGDEDTEEESDAWEDEEEDEEEGIENCL